MQVWNVPPLTASVVRGYYVTGHAPSAAAYPCSSSCALAPRLRRRGTGMGGLSKIQLCCYAAETVPNRESNVSHAVQKRSSQFPQCQSTRAFANGADFGVTASATPLAYEFEFRRSLQMRATAATTARLQNRLRKHAKLQPWSSEKLETRVFRHLAQLTCRRPDRGRCHTGIPRS